MRLLEILGIRVPIIQAPMAGVSTAAMAAAVSNAGALGSIAVGAVDADRARRTIAAAREQRLEIPIIAAGGIMDGAGIAAALRLGAGAAQLGTAFLGCTESAADADYRKALASDAAYHTVMTRAISGRPARCLSNSFTALGECVAAGKIPAYPIAYAAGKALAAAAKAAGDGGYGAQWAGQGAPLVRQRTAAQLVSLLSQEITQRS